MEEDEQDLYNDYRLMTDLREGNHSAFEKIFYTYCTPLKAFAFRQLKSEALAEDAVQEIFSKLWLHRNKLDTGLSLRGFLFTCLKNHILNVVRTRKNEILKNYRFAYHQQDSTNGTEQEVVCSEIQSDIAQFVSHLPELKKNILKLSLYEGLSQEQIARQLNLSGNTVKMYLSQSSRQLRHLINLHGVKFFIFCFLGILP